MALPVRPKKETKPALVTLRLSKKTADWLRILAKEHNMSQADVVEHLVHDEYKAFTSKKNR
jgi:hypothetical protein